MRKAAPMRKSRSGLSKEMLLPMSTERVRALSLEYHLALATVCAGRGDAEKVIHLFRTVYLAFLLRDDITSAADIKLYRNAEAALDACFERGERGGGWLLLDREKGAVERVLVMHDNQLAAVRKHRYLAAWERLQRFVVDAGHSPIPLEKDAA
jgi:hypothetical protein